MEMDALYGTRNVDWHALRGGPAASREAPLA